LDQVIDELSIPGQALLAVGHLEKTVRYFLVVELDAVLVQVFIFAYLQAVGFCVVQLVGHLLAVDSNIGAVDDLLEHPVVNVGAEDLFFAKWPAIYRMEGGVYRSGSPSVPRQTLTTPPGRHR